MNVEQVLQMVDEFGLAMHDKAKDRPSPSTAALNQMRERLHDAIRRLAAKDQAAEVAADAAAGLIESASKTPPPPVDRSQTTLTDGRPVTPDHRELRPDGMQKGYVVLSAEERAKGLVRPVRNAYVHEKCGCVTTMGRSLAETYARDPYFYSGTFCSICRAHFPVGDAGEFVWHGTNEKVGT